MLTTRILPATRTLRAGGVRMATGALLVAGGMLSTPAAVYAQQDARPLDRSGPITYFIAEGAAEPGFKEGDRALAEWAIRAWAKQADPPVDLAPGPEATATVRVYWGANAGLYGEMRERLVEGRPAADVFVVPDTGGLGGDVGRSATVDPLLRDAIVFMTCVHELGHAFGLTHTRGFADIMYSFEYGGDIMAYFMRFRKQLEVRDDIARASPFSSADGRAFRQLYP